MTLAGRTTRAMHERMTTLQQKFGTSEAARLGVCSFRKAGHHDGGVVSRGLVDSSPALKTPPLTACMATPSDPTTIEWTGCCEMMAAPMSRRPPQDSPGQYCGPACRWGLDKCNALLVFALVHVRCPRQLWCMYLAQRRLHNHKDDTTQISHLGAALELLRVASRGGGSGSRARAIACLPPTGGISSLPQEDLKRHFPHRNPLPSSSMSFPECVRRVTSIVRYKLHEPPGGHR